jgi:hypothetical protein
MEWPGRFYRLSYNLGRSGKPYLPLHWSYSEPWERDEEGHWEDLRGRGAQVTDRASWVAEGVLGADLDGHYADYPWALVLDATDCNDSSGVWYAVTREHVTRVRAVPTRAFRKWLRRTYDILDLVQEYDFEDEEETIARWLERNAKDLTVPWVETLPRPQ